MNLGSLLTGTAPSANVGTYNTLTPEQQAALKSILGQLQAPGAGKIDLSGAGTSLTALEQASQNLAGGVPAAQAQKTYSDIQNMGPADINTYFQSTVADPMMKQFKEQVLPTIMQQYPGAAAYGSDKAWTVDRATQDLVNSLTSSRANMAYQAQQSNIANKLAAAQGATSGQASNIQAIIASLGGQLQPAQLQQQAQQYNINDILNALGIKAQENVGVVTPGQPGILQDMAGGLGSALGAYAMYAML